MGVIPRSFSPGAIYVYPKYAAPPFDGIPPAAYQCVGSRKKFLHQRALQPALLKGRIDLNSNHPRPPVPIFLIVWPSSSVPSGGWQLLPASYLLSIWGGALGILITSLSPVTNHTPVTPLIHPSVPLPPPATDFSGLWPTCRWLWWGGGGWMPPTVQKNHRQCSRGGYLPLESIPCPTSGGTWSEYRGFYALSTAPCSPPLGTLQTRPL